MVFASFVVDQPAAPLSGTVEITNPTCHGFSDGQIELTVAGGTAPYTVEWSNGVTTELNSGLPVGTYSFTITDANACTYTEAFTLTEPLELTAEIIATDVSCSAGNTGVLEPVVSGGVPPYTYNWSNGSSESSQAGLSAGVYDLTVTDYNSCFVVLSATINEPAEPLAVSSNVDDVLCHGEETGNIDLTITGGTAPYICNWYNSEGVWLNETSENLSGLAAGNYSVEVVDANNCTESLDITVSEPDAFEYTINLTHVLCFGESTGAIGLELSGATPPYTFIWSNGAVTEDLSDIPAGNYTLSMTDANACTYQIEAEITQPEAPLLSEISIQDVLCYGDKTGAISVVTTGGTEPYSYEWSNGMVENSLENISAGIYMVTVTDANGCQHYTGGEVEEPEAPLTLESNITDASCYGAENGEIVLSLNGGTLPYRVVWDDEEYLINNNVHTLSGLGAGNYHISVLDENNCFVNGGFFVDQPAEVSIVLETGVVSCYGGNDGFANTEISGGTSPYNYQWSDGSNNGSLTPAEAGHYYLTVTDSQNCSYEADVEIETYPEIILNREIQEKNLC